MLKYLIYIIILIILFNVITTIPAIDYIIAIIIFSVIAIILYILQSEREDKRRIERKNNEEKRRIEEKINNENITTKIKEIILVHLDELLLKRKQKTVNKGYGLVDNSEWQKEKDFFIKNVVSMKVPDYPFELNFLISKLLDDVTENYNKSLFEFNENMSPYDYELFVADILQKYNWETIVTKKSGDQGIDIIAKKKGIKLVVQCKLYTGSVGNGAVQEIHAGKAHENADFAIVVTNSSFTQSANEIANTTGVFLLHHDQLSNLDDLLNLK